MLLDYDKPASKHQHQRSVSNRSRIRKKIFSPKNDNIKKTPILTPIVENMDALKLPKISTA